MPQNMTLSYLLREAAHCVNPNMALAHRIRGVLLKWGLLYRPCQQCGGSVGHAVLGEEE